MIFWAILFIMLMLVIAAIYGLVLLQARLKKLSQNHISSDRVVVDELQSVSRDINNLTRELEFMRTGRGRGRR